MARSSRHPREVRERAVALVLESQSDYGSQWEAIVSVAQKVGVSGESLRRWVRQAEVDVGARAGMSSADAEALRELRRENRELRRANEILKAAATFMPTRRLCRQSVVLVALRLVRAGSSRRDGRHNRGVVVDDPYSRSGEETRHVDATNQQPERVADRARARFSWLSVRAWLPWLLGLGGQQAPAAAGGSEPLA
jgi:transposase